MAYGDMHSFSRAKEGGKSLVAECDLNHFEVENGAFYVFAA